MASFDAQIKASQDQVATAQAKISAITARIELSRAKIGTEEQFDVEGDVFQNNPGER